jgi:hypothetical protein
MTKKVQTPKGPRYVFEFAQAAIEPLPAVNITGLRALRAFDPAQHLTYNVHVAVACKEEGELVQFVNLPPEEVAAGDLASWIENELPGLLLTRAKEYEDEEANAE